MTKKTIEGWLLFNWDDGSHRTRKSPPDSTGTYEIATPFEIDVEIPEVDVPEIAAKVEVPQPRVQTAVLESLDDEAFPDWSDVCDEQLARYTEELQQCKEMGEVDRLVDEITTKALLSIDGLAEPEKVHAYVQDQARAVYKSARKRRTGDGVQ